MHPTWTAGPERLDAWSSVPVRAPLGPRRTKLCIFDVCMAALTRGHEIGRKNRDLSAQEVTATLAAISAPRQPARERPTA